MFGLPSDLQGLLTLLAMGAGALFSQLEAFQWFQKLPPWGKLVLQAGLSALGAIGLVLLVWASPAQVATANQLYATLYQIAATIIANLFTHVAVNVIAKPAGKALQGYALSRGVGIGPKG